MAVPHFLRTFNVPYSYHYHTSYVVASLILALVGINLYIHKATFLSLVITARSTAASFQVFFCQYVYISLPFETSLTFLLGLLSAVLIAVALQLSHHSTLLAFIFILLFSHAVPIAVSPLLFSLLGLPCRSSLLTTILNSSCHFYCHAIFIAAVYYIAV